MVSHRAHAAIKPRAHATWLRLMALAVTVNVVAGCYTFVPTEFHAPAEGRLLRVDVSPAGQDRLIPRFGPGVQEVRGMVLAARPDSMSLLVHSLQNRQGTTGVDGQPVRLAPPDVTGVYERRLSRTRSVLFGAGLLAAGFILVETFGSDGRQYADDPLDPTGPVQIRLPMNGSGAVLRW